MQARMREKPSGGHSQRAPLDFPGTPPRYHKEPRQPPGSQKEKDNCWETHSASCQMSASFPGRMSFTGALPPWCVFVSPSAVSNSRAVAHRASLSMKFSRQEHWRGGHFPSPGDLWDPCIRLHCRQILYLVSRRGAHGGKASPCL